MAVLRPARLQPDRRMCNANAKCELTAEYESLFHSVIQGVVNFIKHGKTGRVYAHAFIEECNS